MLVSGNTLMENPGILTLKSQSIVWTRLQQRSTVCTVTRLTSKVETCQMCLEEEGWRQTPGPQPSASTSVRELLAATTGPGSWMRKSTAF